MGLDFLGCEMDFSKCMACEICNGKYTPPGGGILFNDENFIVHQDPYVAIPGFFIISPKRHIYSIDEMTPLELNCLGRIIAITVKAVKEVANIEHITVIQEEKISEGHLHLWIFPWHDFVLSKYAHSLNNIRIIAEYFKSDMHYQEHTITVAEKAKVYFQNLASLDSSLDFHNQILSDQDFSGKNLTHANFQGAVLKRCKFDGCDLSFANFDNADLYRASFCDAKLYSTTLKDADLTRTNFTNAHLYGIKIFGADLSHTIFDDTVQEENEKDFAKAEDIYNTIKRAYSENGNKEDSAKYYYKQCVAKRKQKKGLLRFFNWLIADLLIGYGERLTRCLLISALIIAGFGGLYFFLIGGVDFFGCLLSSIAIFFGFDPVGYCSGITELGIWQTTEQLIGYFFIALALIGVTRKIVRD